MKTLLKFVGYGFLALSALGFFLMKTSDKKTDNIDKQEEVITAQNKQNEFDAGVDSIYNSRIKSLQCTESDFMARQEANSNFIDLQKTSFDKRLIVWKKDFVETKLYIGKKMLQEVARVYRDFDCIDKITMQIYSKEESRWYECKISRKEYESYAGISFAVLREDIKNWREYISSSAFSKENVNEFHKKYIKAK
jgi:hypothetical protein